MHYELNNNIALVTLDDGKVNAVGPAFIDALNDALDRSEADDAGAVVIQGREGMFSAGFDLKEFARGMDAGIAMVEKGMELLIRLYGLQRPVVAACPGHGIAMGAFILLACDTRIGVHGDYRITLPETAISMEIPRVMLELAQSRLPARFMTRAAIQAEVFSPETAVTAGFLDEVVEAGQLEARALAVAGQLAELPREYYRRNKLALRGDVLDRMQRALDEARAKLA
jgi:enoyl-CoA hydratase